MINAVRLVGLLLFLAGAIAGLVTLFGNRKNSTKPEETGRQELEIAGKVKPKKRVPIWLCILMMILGFVLLLGNSFHASISVTNHNGESVLWEYKDEAGDDSEESATDQEEPTDTPNPVEAQDKTPGDSGVGLITPDEESQDNSNPVAGENERTNYTIQVGGIDVSIQIVAGWETYAYDTLLMTYLEDQGLSAEYKDSFIAVDDTEKLKAELDYIETTCHTSVSSGTFPLNGATNYVFTWMDGTTQNVRLYEDVGAETYLCIEIQDYNTQYTVEDLVSMFCFIMQ